MSGGGADFVSPSYYLTRNRLLEIIEAAALIPEPHEFSYFRGQPVVRCLSVRRPCELRPQLGLLAELVRHCATPEEAGQLISGADLRETATEIMLFWRGAEWG